jgi:hypothetical protein
MNELPQPVIRILEFAERNCLLSEIPDHLQSALTFAKAKYLVRVVGRPHRMD